MTSNLSDAPWPSALTPETSSARSTCNECGKVVADDYRYDLSGYVMNRQVAARTYQSAAATLTTEKTTTWTDVLPCYYQVCFDCARVRCDAERPAARAAGKKALHLFYGSIALGAAITGFVALESHPIGVFLGLSDNEDFLVAFIVGCVAVIISTLALLMVVTSRRAMVFRDKPSWLWAVRSYAGLIATNMNRNLWMSPVDYQALLRSHARITNRL
jgi:hypothetical protein